MAAGEKTIWERLSELRANLRIVKSAMRDNKSRAMRKGYKTPGEIAGYIINEMVDFRSRLNDDAIWFGMALQVAGSSRERVHEDDEDDLFNFLEVPVPIRRFRMETNFPDGRAVVNEGDGWVILEKDGSAQPVKEKDIPEECLSDAKSRYYKTEVIAVEDFGVKEGDQRGRQMKENLDRDQAAYDLWIKRWSLIRPILVAHPGWTLGTVVDDLRDRGEWPSELDD